MRASSDDSPTFTEDVTEKRRLTVPPGAKQEALGTLAGGIADDFNNICADLGYAELAAMREPGDKEIAEDLAAVTEGALRRRASSARFSVFSSATRPSAPRCNCGTSFKNR